MKKQFRMFGTIINDDSERWCLDDVTPSQFNAFLRSCGPEDEIELAINSPGGIVTAGLAIANMVKSAKQPITARVYGVAASMAGVIACAAPTLAMFRSSYMMIHNPWGMAMGDADALRQTADVLDSMKSAIIDMYLSKFKTLKKDDLCKMMDDESWILGSECEAYGLSALIEDDPAQMAACVHGPAMFAKIPDAAKKFYAGDPAMPHLKQPDAAHEGQASGAATPPAVPPAEPPASPAVVALSKRVEELSALAAQAEARASDLSAQVAALTAERDTAQAAFAKAEEQRRDHQSKADKLAKELDQARAENKAAAEKATTQISSLSAEKVALEQRIAAISLNALGAPSTGCAQTWDDAIAECGSYEKAKAKYPHLAEAYRLAHAPKGEQSAAE